MEFPSFFFSHVLPIIINNVWNIMSCQVYLLGQHGWMYCTSPCKKSFNMVWPMRKIQQTVAFVKIGLLELKLPFYIWCPYLWTSLFSVSPSSSFCLTFLSSALLSSQGVFCFIDAFKEPLTTFLTTSSAFHFLFHYSLCTCDFVLFAVEFISSELR